MASLRSLCRSPESSDILQCPFQSWSLSRPAPTPHSPTSVHFPERSPGLQLNDLPKKPLPPEFGDLTRTSSEPEVSVVPRSHASVSSRRSPKAPTARARQPLKETSPGPEFRCSPQSFCSPSVEVPTSSRSQASSLPGTFKKAPAPWLPSELAALCCGGLQPPGPAQPRFGARRQRSGALAQSAGSRLGLRPGHLPEPEASTPGQQPGPSPSQAPHCPRPQGYPELPESCGSRHRYRCGWPR